MASADLVHSQHGEKPHCPICLGTFKTPRQLPCLHSFCQGCLEDYISSKAVKVEERKEFECPICRDLVIVPRKGKTSKQWASLFPINSILQSIGGKEKQEVNRPCDCCMSDGVSVTADGFCVVCEEAMCASCLKVHQKQKISKDHSIITIEELTNNPTNFIRFHKGFRCQEHEEEDLKFYCRDHTIACCANCCIVHHRNCGKILDLKKDATNLLLEVKPLQILEEMNKIEDHLMNVEKRNESYIISFESQVQDMTNKIKDIRKKLNDLLDELERKVKSEGNQLYKQEAIRKQEENHECQALCNAMRNSHLTLETVMRHGSDTQIFIMAEKMKLQVKLCYEQIKERFEELGTVTLNLEVDPQIQYILTQMSDIGSVICRKEPESFQISRVERPLKECQLEMRENLKIQGPDDKNPWYTRVTYLKGDQVMLTDFHNLRVILVNSSYEYIASFTLSDKPWDICVVDHEEVAVSFPLPKTLQFLSVTHVTIKHTMNVQTRYECLGVAPAGKAKIVISGNCKNEGKHYWSVINSAGKEEICHQFDCLCGPSATYVALNSSCTCVYITVSLAESLYCFDMDGRMKFIYNTGSLMSPKGFDTDRDDNVYVVARLSDNIHQLTPDGAPIRVISECISHLPCAICFNSSLDRFLITNDTSSDSIHGFVFRLK